MKTIVLFFLMTATFYMQNISLLDKFIANTKFTVFTDVYYSYDLGTNQKKEANRRLLAASAPFNNEFRINLMFFEMLHTNNDFRFGTGVKYGDMPFELTPLEFQHTKFIKKAFFGWRISENAWLDFGYIPGYFGFEDVGINNWLSTISVSNYFQEGHLIGGKLTYAPSSRFSLLFLVFNSYNIIASNNTNKSLGLSLNYNPSDHLSFTYNTLAGDEGENFGSSLFLSFNEIVIEASLSSNLDIAAQYNFAFQQNSTKSLPRETAYYNSALFSLRYSLTNQFKLSLMAETISDPDGFISQGIAKTDNKIKLSGFAAGVSYYPTDFSYLRLEFSNYNCDQNIFYKAKKLRQNITFSTGFKLTN